MRRFGQGPAIIVAVLLVLTQGAAFSQSAPRFATISGKIVDPDGNAVKDAMVQWKDSGSGSTVRAISSTGGEYTISLSAGTYDLNIPMPCCQWGSFAQSNIKLRSGEESHLDIQLPWGPNLGVLGDDPILQSNALRDKAPIAAGPVPVARDGKPDLSGIWINVYNPDTLPAPLRPWAATVFRQRLENNSKDYPGAYCLPANAEPITRAFPWKIVQTPSLIVMLFDLDTPGVRQIFLDGRTHPADMNPTWGGHSIGHWDGDTLVIDTSGYNDKSWLSLTGIPHTETLRTLERIRRTDYGHIEVEVVMDDKGAFTEPWIRTFTATLAPADTEIGEFICNENNRDVGHYRDK